MKIIYSETSKYVLDEKILEKADKAVEKVREIMAEEDWTPSIEIDVPYTRYISALDQRQGMYPTGQIMIIVKPSRDTDDSCAENIFRRLLGKDKYGEIKVDVGEYGPEGWRSIIDHEDLRDISDYYFTMMFVDHIIEPVNKRWIPNVNEVESEHWQELAERIYSQTKANLEEYDYPGNLRKRTEELCSLSEGVIHRRCSVDEIVERILRFP